MAPPNNDKRKDRPSLPGPDNGTLQSPSTHNYITPTPTHASPLSVQSKRALAHSWIDELNKRTKQYSQPSQREKGREKEAGPHKKPRHLAAKGGTGGKAIANLEESYFGTAAAVMKYSSSASLASEEFDATHQRSNKSNSKRDCIPPLSAAKHPAQSDEVAKVITKSQEEENKRQKEEAQFEEELRRAMKESAKQQFRHKTNEASGHVDLTMDDSDDDNNGKLPAKDDGSKASAKNLGNEEAEMNEAIRLSLEEAERPKQRYAESESIDLNLRKLSRYDFQRTVDEAVQEQGGYVDIEKGQMIKRGNANDMKKSCVVDGGGQNQTGAEYGRYTINGMWRVFDVLEGRDGIEIDGPETAESSPRKLSSTGKIKAFVDIGHGIGIQVLQAGWSLGVPARGVELMNYRHLIANVIRESVLEDLRSDPPDSTLVELMHTDFSWAVVPDKKTHTRDEKLRSFLLFRDRSEEVQNGLVIFANNAEEVFGARSNQNVTKCLDECLGELFANMQVGGRLVTLTDISGHLTQSSEWFQHDVFESGTEAVSWGNKSTNVHVLTKLKNEWFCQNKKCSGKYLPNSVLNDNGELQMNCVYCGAPAKRCLRRRKPASRRRQEDE